MIENSIIEGHAFEFPCPLCTSIKTKIDTLKVEGVGDKIEKYECERCGTFYLDCSLFDHNFSPRYISFILHHHLISKKLDHAEYVYTFKKREKVRGIRWVNPLSLNKSRPLNISQISERTLLNLYLYFQNNEIRDLWANQYLLEHLFFISDKIDKSDDERLRRITHTIELLEDGGYLEKVNSSDQDDAYEITLIGKYEAQHLLNRIRKLLSPQVFVAISFAEKAKERYSVIKSAIEKCGYTPFRIDEKEHNNLIVTEIKDEIDQSCFLVAELMDHKPNVYYEAGFAEGRGIEVIFTCHKLDFESADNFDVKQKNMVLYETDAELKEGLIERIQGSIINS